MTRLRDQDGQVIVLMTIIIPVVVLMMGLVLMAGDAYAVSRQGQSVADMAAVSAALAWSQGDDPRAAYDQYLAANDPQSLWSCHAEFEQGQQLVRVECSRDIDSFAHTFHERVHSLAWGYSGTVCTDYDTGQEMEDYALCDGSLGYPYVLVAKPMSKLVDWSSPDLTVGPEGR